MGTGAPRTTHGARVTDGADVEREVVARVVAHLEGAGAPLDDVVRDTLYHEARRSAASGRPLDAFYADLRRDLARHAQGEAVARAAAHYAGEIGGHFDPHVYALATTLLPRGLGLLLHGAHTSTLRDALRSIDDRVILGGELEALRRVARQGTVVLVPTHVSNLDSPLLGWSIHRAGLPPFAYAAGLNLFTSHALGFFMRHLGAYTVDRSNRDPLYKATLKEYTTTLLARGQHVLFFPGGTRSRSGALESHLKLGLLGTLPEAFRRRLSSCVAQPRIYVVPCTLSYPLVLEAASLVEEWLRDEGGARGLALHDEPVTSERWLGFARELRSLDLAVHVRFGKPLDPLGNEVDAHGDSLDLRGHAVDPARYFMERGALSADPARDAEYTRSLAGRIVSTYRAESVALPTSVLAFAMFECLRARAPGGDPLRRLRIDAGAVVPATALLSITERLLTRIAACAAAGRLVAGPDLAPGRRAEVTHAALATFATYHAAPVVQRVPDGFACRDPSLLLYYRNRLDGFGLEDPS